MKDLEKTEMDTQPTKKTIYYRTYLTSNVDNPVCGWQGPVEPRPDFIPNAFVFLRWLDPDWRTVEVEE